VFIDDMRRRRMRGIAVDLRDLEDDLAWSAPPEDRAGMQDVLRATMELSFEHRQILLLVGVEGLSYRQVAEELSLPLGTVMSRLARARERLRQALESPGTAPAPPGAPGGEVAILRPARGIRQ
jgi:RNA polymerase sigma-70 factor (ECF subfamily)